MSKKYGVFHFRPGWMIVDSSSAYGGIRYDRQLIDETTINRGHGMQMEHQTCKTVDNVEFCAAVDAVVKKVDYVLRKHCVRTPVGWFADDVRLARVKEEVAELQDEAEELNTRGAEKANSKRRAHIQIVPLRIDFNHREAVQEITRTIRSVLTDTYDALRAGQLDDLHKLKIRSKNLEQLAVGFQSDAIRFALDRATEAATELRTAAVAAGRGVRNGGGSKEKIAEAKALACGRTGAVLDLTAIEAAINHFEGSVSRAVWDLPDVISIGSR